MITLENQGNEPFQNKNPGGFDLAYPQGKQIH